MSKVMHGEYKVPGGKLVVADVEVHDNVLSRVRIAGDFFLEPDTALDALNTALEGAPASSSVEDLTARASAGLVSAQLVGFTAQSVAMAVGRALGRVTTWEDHTFEVIHVGPQAPNMHMALDEVLALELSEGLRGPTFRLWEWGANAVVIGSYQSYSNEIDHDGAQRHDVEVVRRISGGGAMFIEPGNTITYSLVVPGSLVEGMSFVDSYAFLDSWVLGALASVGVEATYVPINDITSPAGKIAGAAQKRLADGTVLHHVTMAYDIDANKMLEVLRIGREKVSDKGHTSAAKRVDPLRSQTGMSREAIVDAFIDYFSHLYSAVPSTLRDEEIERAEALIKSKFASSQWLHRVP